MLTSADVIAVLHRRRRRSLRPGPEAGEFPPGWQAWFEQLASRPGRVHGAPAAELVAVLAVRTPRPRAPGRVPADRWQAFTSLWRQHWEPPHPDERGLRAFSAGGSGAVHLVLLLAMAVLLFVPPSRGPTQAGDERAIEVTWIGEGTPIDEGGGTPAAVESERDPSASAPAPSAQAPADPVASATPPVQPPPQPAPEAAEQIEPAEPVPAPTPVVEAAPDPTPVAPVEQPLRVTEVPMPDPVFAVPPPPDVAAPTVVSREATVELRTREIALPDAPEIRRPDMQAVQVPPTSRPVEQPRLDVVEREIPSPPREVRSPDIAVPSAPAPVVQRDAQARVREIPMPEPAAGAGEGASEAQNPSAATPAARTDAGSEAARADPSGSPAATQGTRATADSAGSGVSPAAPPGALPSRAPPGDDWGAAARDQAGGQRGTAGLFNRDGRPQLPPGSGGRVGGGLPPGTVTEDYEKIDRMGTWLRRPPNDFEETSLDRFWVPNENLLEEWVRRSIRTVLIPIPGSSKSIRCDVALLAFGGGCGITDPNMQDVEAEARPPPDVPFKPELQDDP